jgi:3-oxoadipate enol-lactonase
MLFANIRNNVHHYDLTGRKENLPLVFCNSLGTDLRIWNAVVARLAEQFRIIRYDNRGHGLTDVPEPPYSIDDLAHDLVGLLDALEVRQAVICGISVGGLIAQRLALIRPDRVRSLVLCDTGARIGSVASWEERITAVRDRGLQSWVGLSMERWFTDGFRSSRPDDIRGYANMLLRTPLDGYIGTCCALRDADLTEEAPRVENPTLVVCGADDVATPPKLGQELAQLIPHAEFSLIERAAHLTCIEQPEALVGRMIRFFREVKIV